MNTPRPLSNAEDLQHLIERFHRAQWITGVSMVSSEPLQMDFTLLGLRRMRQLFEVFDSATAENFPDQSNFHATDSGGILMDQFVEALSELYPPHLSQPEKDALLGLTMALHQRQRS